jgi:F0F1-type ATP synthase alpha subunit
MLYAYFDKEKSDILAILRERKQIDSSLEEAINAAMKEFTARFKQDAA